MSLSSRIFENNKDWINSKLDKDGNFFTELAKGQSPELLYIGCADSRVTAEELMGMGPGDVFVHRNVANLVPSLDLNSKSVINYAVAHLGVSHAVVCGHYGCGGVKAAMDSSDLGILNPWLENIKDVIRIHRAELESIADPDRRYERTVELNAIEQCNNLIKLPEVQQAVASGKLTIHAWVFDLASGQLKDLNYSAEQHMGSDLKMHNIS